jgi:hypothetical protein
LLSDEQDAGLGLAYGRALPASDVNFDHKWRDVTTDLDALRVARDFDFGEDAPYPARAFVREHGPSMMYPLSFFGIRLGWAMRSLASKDFISLARWKDSKAFTTFAFDGDLRPHSTVVVVEGYSDAEAVGNFYPATFATMGGPVAMALVPLVRRFFSGVATMFDNDDAGYEFERKVRRRMSVAGIDCRRIGYPGEYGDPADFFEADPEEMRRRLEDVNC